MFIDYDGHNKQLIKDLVYTDFGDGYKVYNFFCQYKDFVRAYYGKDITSMGAVRGVMIDFTPLGYDIKRVCKRMLPVLDSNKDNHLKMFVEEGNDFYWSFHFQVLFKQVINSSIIEFYEYYMDDEERIDYYVETLSNNKAWFCVDVRDYFKKRFISQDFQKNDIKKIETLLTTKLIDQHSNFYAPMLENFFETTLPYTKKEAEEVIGRSLDTCLPCEMDDGEFTLLEINGLI